MNAVRDCIDSRVRCVTILSNGFAEEGDEGRARQDKLVALAKEGGVRILGPNSLGIINLTDKVALSANEILSLPELTAGACGLISQRGSLIGADRKSVVSGKSVSVRVDLGGRRIIKKKEPNVRKEGEIM